LGCPGSPPRFGDRRGSTPKIGDVRVERMGLYLG
jgi:hypothetical protein